MAWGIRKYFFVAAAGLTFLTGLAQVARAQDGQQSAISNPQSTFQLRVPFVRNQGQLSDPQLLFFARTFGGTVYVTAKGELVYALPRTDDGSRTTDDRAEKLEDGPQSKIENRKSAIPQLAVIREVMVDADLISSPAGADRSGAVISSFIGNDPRRWQSDIPAFDGVRFGEIYEGIALEVRAAGNNVEKIFTVAPGADPALIAMHLQGATGLCITPEGELEAQTVLGSVRFSAPVAFQTSPGGARESVPVVYALEGDRIGFCVGAYDVGRPLVIDPLLASTFIGGTQKNVIRAMALDSQSNVLAAGYTASLNFPTTNSPYQRVYGGGLYDAFVAKFDPLLTNLIAATYLGGAGEDAIQAMVVNTNDNSIYVAGYTASTNFPMRLPIYASYRGGAYDAFVAVLNSNLTNLMSSTYLGGANVDKASALVTNLFGEVYVAGYTASGNFPTNNTYGSTYQDVLRGSNDAFVTKFNAGISATLASTYVGGSGNDQAFGVSVDTNDFVYIAGLTTSANFPVSTNGFRRNLVGGTDAFISKLSGALTNMAASTYLGGSSNDAANGIAVAPITNMVYVVGYTESANFTQNPTNNLIAPGYTNRYIGGKDAFLTRLDLNLTNVQASTYCGGANDDEATAVMASITTNATLRIYMIGYTASSNFPVTTNAYDTTANGGLDAFVALWGTNNNFSLTASTYLGGNADEQAYAMALTPDRFSLFVGGATASSNFPVSMRAYQTSRVDHASEDGFVTKLASGLAYGTPKWRIGRPQGDIFALFISPSLGWDGSVYVGVGSNLCAYDDNGNMRWSFRAQGRLHDDGGGFWGLGSTPAVAKDGTMYFGTMNGYLHAVSKDGIGLWTNLFVGQSIYSSPALGNDGTIYFGSSLTPFSFYAVSSNGAVKWTANLTSSIIGSPAIDTNGRVFVASSHSSSANFNRLYMINTNGTIQTNWSLSSSSTASSPMIGSNGWVYIGSGTKLYGFNPNNGASQIWSAAGSVLSSPAMDSNNVIYVGGGNNLYAFNTNGTTKYTWVTQGAIMSSPAIAEDGTIYVGAANSNLYAFSSNGKTNWVFQTDYDLNFQSPLLRRDGTIYFADLMNMYAICGKSAGSRSSWPTYKHDLLRTGNAAFDVFRFLKPTGLTVSKGAYLDRVEVSWNGNVNAEYYELYRSLTNNPVSASLLATTFTTNITDRTIVPGKIYYYWVRVNTPVAASDFSDVDSGGIPPWPPVDLTASKGNPTNAIALAWTTSSNATAYYVYRSAINATNTAVLVAVTNVTQYTNSPNATNLPITRGLTYYYWVKAGNGVAGISDFSASDYGGTPPLPPLTITAGSNSSQAVYVDWSSSTGATMYAVYRAATNIYPEDFLAVTNALALADTTAVPFQNYYYWVRATNQYGMGEFSDYAVGRRLMGPPLSVYATRGAFPNKIRVSWQIESTAPTSYRVYRNLTPDPDTAQFRAEVSYSDPTATNYDDLNITRGAGYYYWVQSKNAFGTSEYKRAERSGGTVPYPPQNVIASGGTDYTKIIVTWNAADYTVTYAMYRQESYVIPSENAPPLIDWSGTIYNDASAHAGQRYYYWLRSTNEFGRSELSGFSVGWRPLLTPYAISAGDGTSTEHVHVTWTPSEGATTYELWRGTNNSLGNALVLNSTVPTNSYDDAASAPGVIYYYWVRAKTQQFESDFSPSDSGYRSLGQVDIGVSDLVFLPTAMKAGGAPAVVSFRVTNYGQYDMFDPNDWVVCNFYISSNPIFNDGDDRWMGGATVKLPAPIGGSTVSSLSKAICATLSVPLDVSRGSYYIFVNIQHALPSKWMDPNQGNNTAVRNGGVIKVDRTQPVAFQMINDFNGDGYTDAAVYQGATGTWKVWFFGNLGVTAPGFGGLGFAAIPADYDGDGKTDPAVYQEATGTWEVWLSSCDYAMAVAGGLGGPGFDPAPADYDGDGKADPAVYQESTGTWRAWLSGANYSFVSVAGVGGLGFRHIQGDYDGDGKADPAVYQETTGTWKIWRSSFNYALVSAWGMGGNGYRPVPADYDHDGLMDPAIFRETTGTWQVWLSASQYAMVAAQGLGVTGVVAVPGDYDGDGKADPAIYWDSFGMWRLWLSSLGYQQVDVLAWPGDGYRPVWQ